MKVIDGILENMNGEYAFRWFARAIANPQQIHLRQITYLEYFIELDNTNIYNIAFDINESNPEKLIFYVKFKYLSKAYDIVSEITSSLLNIININIEVFDTNENVIDVPTVKHEATCALYNIFMKEYSFKDFED